MHTPFIFFGTPDTASRTLQLLKQSGLLPAYIVTNPDKPVGRKQVMTASPVKDWAIENGIPYMTPEKITREVVQELQTITEQLSVTVFLVVAYGKILPQVLIDIPENGTYNIHYSLLPKYRGATPAESAILHGDSETGITLQKMVFKLDAGPIVSTRTVALDGNETTESLRDTLIPLGTEAVVELFKTLDQGLPVTTTDQDETYASHCGKISKDDGLVHPYTDDPLTLWRKYRAYSPWPMLYFFDKENNRIKITHAVYENEQFKIKRVIYAGKPESEWFG